MWTVNATCADVNECKLVPPPCGRDFLCEDTAGSFQCIPCHDNSTDHAGCYRSESEDPCMPNPCRNRGLCRRGLAGSGLSYWCDCATGFVGAHCLDPVDDGAGMPETCSPDLCLNGGLCDVTQGRARCTCKQPWTGPYCQVIF
jgi:EGF-like domain